MDPEVSLLNSNTILALITLALFQATRLSSPGFVSPLESDEPSKLPYCQTCHVHKLVRSVHDKHTDRCIQRFDHYNLWIRAPIGSDNYRAYVFFLCFQFLHSYQLWSSIGEIVRHRMSLGFSVLLVLALIAWIIVAFTCCSFGHFFARNVYHVMCNITSYEVNNFQQLQYITFDPYYFNLFDLKWTENISNFFTQYKKEHNLWETEFQPPGTCDASGDILGVILQASGQPTSEEPAITPEQAQDDDELIKQWLIS